MPVNTDEILNGDGLTEKEYLAEYRADDYERPSVAVDMLIFGTDSDYGSLKILLIKRNNHPYINKWAFPGGFVGIDESAYQAACRELYSKTGLRDIYMEQLYTFTNPGRDPRMRVIDIAYMALIPACPAVCEDAVWFTVRLKENSLIVSNPEFGVHMLYSLDKKFFKNGVIKIENYDTPVPQSEEQLGFDHAQILVESILRLRNKAEYTDIVFNLMPEEFTMTDLMNAYETVLGKKLYRKNFRDKMKTKTSPTGNVGYSKASNGTTPSALYKYNG